MELMILKGLNWGLSPMTPNAWMRLYLQILHGSKSPNDDAFSLPAYSGLPFSRVMQLLDLAVLDVGSLEFSYSVLATSALCFTEENHEIVLSVSGYKWEDIARCVRWMAAFSSALGERLPLQPKSFHGIQPDDAHHLQNHSIDLQLLERAQEICANVLRESPDPMAEAHLAPTGLEKSMTTPVPAQPPAPALAPPHQTEHVTHILPRPYLPINPTRLRRPPAGEPGNLTILDRLRAQESSGQVQHLVSPAYTSLLHVSRHEGLPRGGGINHTQD